MSAKIRMKNVRIGDRLSVRFVRARAPVKLAMGGSGILFEVDYGKRYVAFWACPVELSFNHTVFGLCRLAVLCCLSACCLSACWNMCLSACWNIAFQLGVQESCQDQSDEKNHEKQWFQTKGGWWWRRRWGEGLR